MLQFTTKKWAIPQFYSTKYIPLYKLFGFMPTGKLIVKKEDFELLLKSQIESGYNLLDREISEDKTTFIQPRRIIRIKEYDESEKELFLADYKKWDSFNLELISRSFDENDSPYSYFRFLSVWLNRLKNKLLANYLRNRGNDLATVRISAFCVAMLSNNSLMCKDTNFLKNRKCVWMFFLFI